MVETPVLIVGGGISGLSTAYLLDRSGIPVTLLERESLCGGLIQTIQAEDCTLETGPDSFLATKPAVRELAADLGISNDLISSNDERRRVFLLREGKLIPLPKGMVMMTPTDLTAADDSELFSEEAKARFREELSFPATTRQGDFSVGDLVASHFGNELLEYVTEPLLAGVYGGSAGQLSARSVLPRFVDYEATTGSLIRGAQGETRKSGTALFQSFRNGMGQLPGELVRSLSARVSILRDTALQVTKSGPKWIVRTQNGAYSSQNLVLSLPAYASAELLEMTAPELSSLLREIPYSSAILCNLLFHTDELVESLDGFGFLVPARERQIIAAATWVNTKFPSRVKAGVTLIRVFIVGAEASQNANTADSELLQAVRADLTRILRIGAEPFHSLITRWPHSMPQYVLGHESRVQRIQERAAQLGLHLVSNYLDGVGIPDCIRIGTGTAKKISAKFHTP